jgi:hypothetical protein
LIFGRDGYSGWAQSSGKKPKDRPKKDRCKPDVKDHTRSGGSHVDR